VQAPKGASQEVLRVLEACSKTKPKAKPEDIQKLREYLEREPELWRVAGDLGELAARGLVDGLNGPPFYVESVRVGRLAKRRELGFETASPLERALIDHAVLCWTRLQLAEQDYTRTMSQSVTLTLGDYMQRKLSAVQRRYLRACETLARVRRLGLPPVQLNIAERQVNVAQG